MPDDERSVRLHVSGIAVNSSSATCLMCTSPEYLLAL